MSIDVAGYGTDPRNEPLWIGGIVESTPLTDAPMAKGARVKRVARFLGRRIEYVNEVLEYEPQRLLAMRSVSGPFPMTIRYEFEEAAGGTLARIRVRGDASGFYRLASPLLAAAVKRSVSGDLKRLKRLLESDGDGR